MCLHMCVYLALWANNQFFKVCGIDSENIQTKNFPFPLPATDAGKYLKKKKIHQTIAEFFKIGFRTFHACNQNLLKSNLSVLLEL